MVNCKNAEKTEDSVKIDTHDQTAEASPALETDFGQLIDQSPRHQEWVTLNSNNRELYTFAVYPEKTEKATTVIVIHENRGLNDWARYFADQLADQGFIALAPDLLSNTQENIKKTTDFENSDKARDAIYQLKPDTVTADLDAVFAYAKKIASGNGDIAVIGFCWGGTQTFRYATNNAENTQANVFYGTAPEDADELKKINVPVYGYYGGDDNRVNATIEKTENLMAENNKVYEPIIYEGAGHAFMRRGAEASGDTANKTAHDKAWDRLLSMLNKK